MMYNVHCYIQGDKDVKQEEGEDKKDVVGNRMLTMAGFFDIWTSSQRDVSTLLYIFSLFPSVSLFPTSSFPNFLFFMQESPLFTYTVITVAANETFSVIHHRMPVREMKENKWKGGVNEKERME